jgi:hypothetical protein
MWMQSQCKWFRESQLASQGLIRPIPIRIRGIDYRFPRSFELAHFQHHGKTCKIKDHGDSAGIRGSLQKERGVSQLLDLPIRWFTQIFFSPEANELTIKAQQSAVRFSCSQRMLQSRSKESVLVLRVRNLFFPFKRRKLFTPAAAHSLDQLGVGMTGEVLKGRSLAVLFAHEKQGYEGREQADSSRKLKRFKVHEAAQPFSRGAISHLIVILVRNHEVAR